MVYKKYIKRDGKVFGPYYYESYRDEDGNVKKRYVPFSEADSSVTPTLAPNLFLFLLIGVFSIFFIIGVVSFFSTLNLKFTGFSIAPTEQVLQEFDNEKVDLDIIKEKNIQNKILNFDLENGSLKLYFDLLNYSEFVETAAEEIDNRGITGNVVNEAEISENQQDLNEVKKNIKSLSSDVIEKVAEESIVKAENFDIKVNDSKANQSNPEYKWGYKIKLKDYKFLAKIDVSSDQEINITSNDSFRIGNNILSFNDLTRAGYKVRIERPALDINFNQTVSNLTLNVTNVNVTLVNKTLNDSLINNTLIQNLTNFTLNLEILNESINFTNFSNENVSFENQSSYNIVEINESTVNESISINENVSFENQTVSEEIVNESNEGVNNVLVSEITSNVNTESANLVEESLPEQSVTLEVNENEDTVENEGVTEVPLEETGTVTSNSENVPVEESSTPEIGGITANAIVEYVDGFSILDIIRDFFKEFFNLTGRVIESFESKNQVTIYIEKDFSVNQSIKLGQIVYLDPRLTTVTISLTDIISGSFLNGTRAESGFTHASINPDNFYKNLSLYFSFDSTFDGSYAHDYSNNDNNGTIVNADYGSGVYSSSIEFSGDDYISVPDSPSLQFGSDDFAISAWIYLQSCDPDYNSGYCDIVSKSNAGGWIFGLRKDDQRTCYDNMALNCASLGEVNCGTASAVCNSNFVWTGCSISQGCIGGSDDYNICSAAQGNSMCNVEYHNGASYPCTSPGCPSCNCGPTNKASCQSSGCNWNMGCTDNNPSYYCSIAGEAVCNSVNPICAGSTVFDSCSNKDGASCSQASQTPCEALANAGGGCAWSNNIFHYLDWYSYDTGIHQNISVDVSLNAWHNVIITRTNVENYNFYLDGSSIGGFTDPTSTYYTTGPLRVAGQEDYFAYKFQGAMDELMIFKGNGLSGGDITNIYSGASNRFVSSGTQTLKAQNISVGSAGVNLTVRDYQRYISSNLSARIGYWDVSKGYFNNDLNGNDGLVAYYHMDESSWTGSSGEVKDVRGFNNGTAYGGATTISNGYFSRAGNFNGSNYVGISGANLNLVNSWTYSAWVKRNAAGGVLDMLFDHRASDSSGRQIAIYFSTANYVQVDIPYIGAIITSSGTLTDTSNWHLITVTKNSNTNNWTIYVDGVVSNSVIDSTAQESTTATFYLGASLNGGTSYYSRQQMDEAMIFNRAITENEVQELYTKGRNNWTFTDSQGFRGYDSDARSSNIFNISKTSSHIITEFGFNTNPSNFYSPLLMDGSSNAVTIQFGDLEVPRMSVSPQNQTHSNKNFSFVNITSVSTSEDHSVVVDWNRSLVGWWRLEQGNGSFFMDNSSYGNNGSCSGGSCPTYTLNGKLGGAYDFNGSSYVNATTNLDLDDLNNFTFSLWAMNYMSYSVSNPDALYKAILNNYDNATNDYLFSYWPGDIVAFSLKKNNVQYEVESAAISNPLNTWHHFVGIYNGSGLLLYVDGVRSTVVTLANSRSGAGSGNLEFGRRSTSGGYLNGSIDDVQIYNRVLGDQEILALYNASANQYYRNFTSLPEGRYSFRAYAQDEGGDMVDSTWYDFYVDEVIPRINFTSPTFDSGRNQTVNFTFINVSSSDSSDHSVFVNLNNSWTSTGLVGWWRFNDEAGENSSLFRDWEDYGRNATCSGSTCPNLISNGKFGSGIKFNSAEGDYATFGTSQLTSGPTTLSFWYGGYNSGSVLMDLKIINSYGYYVTPTNLNSMTFYPRNSAGPGWYTNPFTPKDWNNVVFVYDGRGGITDANSFKIYVNGQSIAFNAAGWYGGLTNANTFGRNSWSSDGYFNGSLDDIMIFNRALNNSEVLSLYNASANKYAFNHTNLLDGNYTIQSFVQDLSGNVNQTEVRNLIIDTKSPIVLYLFPTNNSMINNRQVYFSANFTDNSSLKNVSVYVWNSSRILINSSVFANIINNYNTSNISVNLPYDGNFTWNFYVCDIYNNCGFNSSYNRSMILDTTAPNINITYPLNTTYNINVRAINYTYFDINRLNGSCWYSNNSGVWNSSTVGPGTNFTGVVSVEGSNNWTVYCNDSVGNLNSSSILFVKDTPQIIIDRLYPSSTYVNVTQGQFFYVTTNISCLNANCGNVNVTLDPISLVPTISYNFTTCGATGRLGPNQTQCDSNYSGTSLDGNVNVINGAQYWTVPTTGNYLIETWGAKGGRSITSFGHANGSIMSGVFYLTSGTKLKIIVGQVGGNDTAGQGNGNGGGGGSFVAKDNVSALIVAGGASGAPSNINYGYCPISSTHANGRTTTAGGNASCLNAALGGVNGLGGDSAAGGSYLGAGGGGFIGNGTNGKIWCSILPLGGGAFNASGAGGLPDTCNTGGFGGFGGGGAGNLGSPGGGGGYSGGAVAGTWYGYANYGGGGGSYVNATASYVSTSNGLYENSNTFNGAVITNYSSYNSLEGRVRISLLSPKGGTIPMNSSFTPFYTNITNPYNITLNENQSQVITWWVNASGAANNSLPYEFFIYANKTDEFAYGNMSAKWNVTIVNFTVDNVAPILTILNPLNNSNYNALSVGFNVSSNENVSWCGLSLDGNANITMTRNSTNTGANYTNSTMSQGYHNFTISCNDTNNNFGSALGINLLTDSVVPGLNLSSPTNGTTYGSLSVLFNVSSSETGSGMIVPNLDSSLVSWWRMDDLNSTGGVVDYMGVNNGSNVGARQVDNGKFGKAFNFSGSNNITIPHSASLSLTKNFTISVWIRAAGHEANYQQIVSKGAFTEQSGGYGILMDSTGAAYKMWISYRAGSLFAYTATFGSYSSRDNTWVHLVGIYNGTALYGYVNGVKNSSYFVVTNGAGTNINSTLIGQGMTAGGANDFIGDIDEVMIFNRSLTDQEIMALYNATAMRFNNTLLEGNHNYRAYASDVAGNINASSLNSFTISLADTTSPNVSSTVIINQSSTNNGRVTKGDNFSVNVTVSDNVNVTSVWMKVWQGAIGISNVVWQGFLNFISGNLWSAIINVNSTWNMGILNYTIYANDSVNNVGNLSGNITIVGELVPPYFTGIGNFSTYNNVSLSYKINASDNVGIDSYAINWTDSFSINSGSGLLTNISQLVAGLYAINVTINDTSANYNSSIMYLNVSFIPDRIAPYFIGLNNVSITIEESLNYDINAADNYIFDGFAINWTNTFAIDRTSGVLTNTSVLNLGYYYINVTINDSSGNYNSSVIYVRVTPPADIVAPILTILNPLNNSNYNALSVGFNVSSNENVSWCGLSLDNNVNVTMTRNSTNTGANYTNSTMSQGYHNFTISCNDTSNNFARAVGINLLVDSIVPGLNLISPVNNTKYANSSVLFNVSSSETGNGFIVSNLDNSLVGWWRMDDVSGNNIIDYLGINNGTKVGGAVQVNNGKFGKGMNFDGVDDYIVSSQVLNTANATISAWVKVVNYPASSGLIAGFVDGYGSSTHDKDLFLGSDGKIYFYIYDTGTETTSEPTNSIDTNTWVHVVGTTDSNITRAYVNGVEVGSVASGPSFTGYSVPNFLIQGTSGIPSYGGLMNASIDEVMVFNRSLTSQEIMALYNATAINFNNNLSDRSHSYKTYSSDFAGNVNASNSITFGVDSLSPNVNFTSPTNPGRNNLGNSIYVNVSSSDVNDHSVVVDWNRSLVGWWRFNDNNTLDSSGYGNNGTNSGSIWNSSGKLGGAMGFNGSNYVNAADSNSLRLLNFTISLWVKGNQAPSDSESAVISKGGTIADENYIFLWGHSVSNFRQAWSFRSDSTWYNAKYITSLQANTWYNLVGVYNGTTLIAYLNGVMENYTIAPVPNEGANELTIGNVNLHTQGFNGTIDDVQIYNRAFSADEILAIYNASANQYSHNFTNLNYTNYTVKAYAQDVYGNVNMTEQRNIALFENDSAAPNLTSPIVINQSGTNNGRVTRGDNVTINATIWDNINVGSVWINIWENAIGSSNILWQGFMNWISGNLWSVVIGTNSSWNPGLINYSIYANDSLGNIANISGNITMVNELVAPYFTGIGDVFIYDNESLSYQINATDNLQFDSFAINWTNTFVINRSSGLLTNISMMVEGDHYINVSINDSDGNVNSSIMLVRVLSSGDTSAPKFIDIRNLFVCEGSALNHVFNASDEDGDLMLAYVSPTDLFSIEYYRSVNFTTRSYRLFSGTLTKANVGGIRNISKIYPLELKLVDDGVINITNINVTVLEINHAPVMENYSNQNLIIGNTFYKQFFANDTEDGNSTDGNLSWGVVTSNSTLFNISSTGVMEFVINSTYLGVHNLSVCAVDRGLPAHPNISLCRQTGNNLSICRNFLFNISYSVSGNVTQNAGGGGGGGSGKSYVGGENGTGGATGEVSGENLGQNRTGTSKYNCGDWSECRADYNVSDVVENKIIFRGQTKRECTDIKTQVIFEEKRLCDNRAKIILRKKDECYTNILQVFDEKEGLVSRMSFDNSSDRLDIQFIFDNKAYCPYCYDKKQDYDETGIDCGGSCGRCDKSIRVYSPISNTMIFGSVITVLFLVDAIALLLIRYYAFTRELIILRPRRKID